VPANDGLMARALELAIENIKNGVGGPFGAIVVRNGAIVAEGVNQVTATNDPTAHAEIVAIRRACQALQTFQLDDCEIYTSCEPCPMCLGAIYWARPARIYYAGTREDAREAGFDDDFIYEQIAVAPDHRAIPMQQLMRERARQAFRLWTESPNAVRY